MKCTQCGAPITIEDEFCPYCGALNQAARQHQVDMKKYGREFEETRSTVMSRVNVQIQNHAQMAALGVVILLLIIVFICLSHGYELEDWLEARQINRQADTHIAALSSYEESGDYPGLYSYYRNHSLYQADRDSELDSFSEVCQMAGYYTKIQYDFYYLTHTDVESYQSRGDLLEQIADLYVDFEDIWNYTDSPYYEKQLTGNHLVALKDMEDRMQTMLQSYGNLTEEDMEKLPDMGSQDLMILLGKRMGDYE